MKTMLIVLALALLGGLALIGFRSEESFVVASISEAPRGPSFKVQVVKPRSARPLFGILPAELEAKLAGHGDLGFDNASPEAGVGSVGEDRLELSADGWELSIETDSEGQIAPGAQLVFPIELANQQRRLRCRPDAPASGYLRTSARADSGGLHGSFLLELAACENTETGKLIEWPPAPLTVSGSFAGLARSRR